MSNSVNYDPNYPTIEVVEESEKNLRSKNKKLIFRSLVLVIFLSIILFNTFGGSDILISPFNDDISLKTYSWWGLSSKTYSLHWFDEERIKVDDGVYDEGWYIFHSEYTNDVYESVF